MFLFLAALFFSFACPLPSDDYYFDCSNGSLLETVTLLRGGWNKQAEQARYLYKQYTVKRPSTRRAKSEADRVRKLNHSSQLIAQEFAIHSKLHHYNMAVGYGGCATAEPFVVTEFVDGYQYEQFAGLATPWCVRSKIALQLANLLVYLDGQRAIHCDLKRDQFMVRRKDYRLVLVDLDAVQFHGKANRGYLAGDPCDGDGAMSCADLAGECFQFLNRGHPGALLEAQCPEEARCPGFTTASMLWAAGVDLVPPLQETGAALLAEQSDVERAWRKFARKLSRDLAAARPQQRPSAEQFRRRVAQFIQKNGADRCLTQWLWHGRDISQ